MQCLQIIELAKDFSRIGLAILYQLLKSYDLLLRSLINGQISLLVRLTLDKVEKLLNFRQVHKLLQERVEILDVNQGALNDSLTLVFRQYLVQFVQVVFDFALQLLFNACCSFERVLN